MFRIEFFDFRLVSLSCVWRWHLVPVRDSKIRYFSNGLTLEINKSSVWGCKELRTRVSSLRRDAKIKKFDTKTKFHKQSNTLRTCTNFTSIDWYKKKYHKILWDYPFSQYTRKHSGPPDLDLWIFVHIRILVLYASKCNTKLKIRLKFLPGGGTM
jgi:hypothetical protein